MRVVFAVPMFGPELTNGSEYFEYMLACGLVQRGAQVTALATCANRIRSNLPLVIDWHNDGPASAFESSGIRIERFPISVRLPRLAGIAVARWSTAAWREEERVWGAMLAGSRAQDDHLIRRAQNRPALANWLMQLGMGPWSFPMLRRLDQLAADADVIVGGFFPFATVLQAWRVAQRRRKPFVLLPFFHPGELYHYWQPFFDVIARADAVLTLTRFSTELMQARWPTARPVEIGAGVDLAQALAPGISGARFRQKYGLEDGRIVLFVGRKEYGKRYDLAVTAMELLGDPEARLVMIGGDEDRKPIRSTYVSYLGKIPRADVLDAYDACDVVIMPSQSESFGMVALEGWARRKPVLANAMCRPVASVVRHGEDGFLCLTAQDFADRLAELLDDSGLCARLGEAGHARVLTRYNWSAVADSAYQVLSDVIAQRNPDQVPQSG